MKKFLAVFMAVLMLFSCMSVISFAEDSSETTTVAESEEKTTRNILNADGLVVPINFTQLKFSTIFKIFEKLYKFVLKLFAGDDAEAVDESIATAISSIGDDVSGAIEEGSQFIEDNQ